MNYGKKCILILEGGRQKKEVGKVKLLLRSKVRSCSKGNRKTGPLIRFFFITFSERKTRIGIVSQS